MPAYYLVLYTIDRRKFTQWRHKILKKLLLSNPYFENEAEV